MVTARYMRGEAVKAIAARENRSEGSVSVLLHRVRQILAECVDKERTRLGASG
jgi:DNA-directed RNA polymerase specialized sigma24 family protein